MSRYTVSPTGVVFRRLGTIKSAWVPAGYDQDSPFSDALVEVQLEKPGRRFAFIRQRLDDRASKDKVILPTLESRVEETDNLVAAGIDRNKIATLPGIASQAGIGQVAGL